MSSEIIFRLAERKKLIKEAIELEITNNYMSSLSDIFINKMENSFFINLNKKIDDKKLLKELDDLNIDYNPSLLNLNFTKEQINTLETAIRNRKEKERKEKEEKEKEEKERKEKERKGKEEKGLTDDDIKKIAEIKLLQNKHLINAPEDLKTLDTHEKVQKLHDFIQESIKNPTSKMIRLQTIRDKLKEFDLNFIQDNPDCPRLTKCTEEILQDYERKIRIEEQKRANPDRKLEDKLNIVSDNIIDLIMQDNKTEIFNKYEILMKNYIYRMIETMRKENKKFIEGVSMHKLMYFIDCFKTYYQYLKINFHKLLDYIEITKIQDTKKITDSGVFLNINGFNKIITLKFHNYNNLVEERNKHNNEISPHYFDLSGHLKHTSSENKNAIGSLNYASFYRINYSTMDYDKSTKPNKYIIIGILISNTYKKQFNNSLNDDYLSSKYEALFDNKIDGSNDNEFKELLILFRLYIDIIEINKSGTKGGTLNKSYQLYMNAKNKYYIIYDKKNIYLNKDNTYKKNNKLYVKVNGTNNLEIKY